MSSLEVTFASGERSLAVHQVLAREAVSSLFTVTIVARSPDYAIDLGALVGEPARLVATAGHVHVQALGVRRWGGIVRHAEQTLANQLGSGQTGLSTYQITLVPALWKLTRRQGNRIYQHLAIPDIIDRLLAEHGVKVAWQVDRGQYPKLEYKVQYGESDYHFFCRLLEEAGIAFTFVGDEAEGSILTLSDHLEGSPARGASLRYVDHPGKSSEQEFATQVRVGREVRPGALSIRDSDFRNPAFALFGGGTPSPAPEDRLEQYHYDPGAFLAETGKGGETPTADDQGFARYDPAYGQALAERSLAGDRVGDRSVSLITNAYDLAPGVVFAVDHHPHPALPAERKLLVLSTSLEARPDAEWTMSAHAVYAEVAYRPPRRTVKPVVHGVQSATVVGPSGQEIHTDEFGRIRVQFPWDREGKKDERSSCWVRVHEGWGGAGYGFLTLPRIGQEVLVTFLVGDPDQPAIVGRSYNGLEQVPYRLPEHKTRSTWKSHSSPNADGFNEIMFEDLKGQELVWEQAQKDRQRLVKNDEQSTIVHDRQKLVKNDETDRTEGLRQRWVGKDADLVTKQHHRVEVQADHHVEVRGARRELVIGAESLTVMFDQQEQVEGRHGLRAGQQVHLLAGEEAIGEGAQQVTLRGPGGFIRMDGAGIVIEGTLVKINVDGSPGRGPGAHPDLPLAALSAAAAVLQNLDAQAASLEPLPSEDTKPLRLAQRQARISSAQARAAQMPEGSPERAQLEAAAERMERNNHAVEMAKLSQSVYKDEGAPEGWTRLSRDELPAGMRDQVWEDKDSGFYAAMYRSDDGKMVLAYRGTNELKDWKANIPQGLGFETTQYNQANRLALATRNAYGPQGFEVTGHSLGGGLASFASVSTGATGTIFNAAGLNAKTAARAGADIASGDSLIESFHVKGEVLTAVQSVPGASKALGKHFDLPGMAPGGGIPGGNAMKGAALGSVLGPKGAMIGASVGGVVDLVKGVKTVKESVELHGIQHAVDGLESQKQEDMQTMQPPGET